MIALQTIIAKARERERWVRCVNDDREREDTG
jgi:hypothetical protein